MGKIQKTRPELSVWYTGCPYPDHVRADLQEISQVCDRVLLAFTEIDRIVAPRKLEFYIKTAHEMGIEVDVNFWGYGGIFVAAGSSIFAAKNLDCCQVGSDGKPVGICCPNNSKFRKFMLDSLEDFFLNFPADGIFWDEPRLGNAFGLMRLVDPFGMKEYRGKFMPKNIWYCRCKSCQALFKKQFGKTMPTKRDKQVEEFRANTMRDFLSVLCQKIKSINKDIKTTACVMSTDSQGWWEAIASIEALDIFATDPYWEISLFGVQEEMKPFVKEQTLRCKNLAQKNGKESEIWVQSWSIPKGREPEVYQAAKLIASLGVDRINACSYREYLAFGLTHDPETCWQNLKRAYKEIRNA